MSAILRYKRALTLGAFVATAVTLAGCTTLGGNVSGDFSCSAPNGSCAPSSTIDDQAIAGIQDRSSNEAVVPAGPYEVDDGDAPGMRMASAETPPRASRSVPRANGRVLRVVFPAYVDRYGQLHEKSAVQAKVEVGQVPQLAEWSTDGRQGSAPDAGLFGAAKSAPQMLALATPASPKIEVQLSTPSSGVTGPRASQAVGASPIASIKEQVAKKLADDAKLQAPEFPGQVD